MIVVSLDPGGRTGWATFNTKTKFFEGGQFNNTDGHHKELWEFLVRLYALYCNDELSPNEMIVVIESFEFRNDIKTEGREGLELVSREYIGIARLFSEIYGVKLIQQMPGHALRFVSNEKLDKLGLLEGHKPVSSVYNKDYIAAMKHLIFFLTVRMRIREGITDRWKRT